jgi:carbon-monoxide dehydrogenase small subunit
MKFTLNGTLTEASPAARTHLADFLRDEQRLTGTHIGCEHGVCGACTVLVDGALTRACIMFAPLVAGRRVTTIEGLADDPLTAALRTAFTAEHALQCGFCTPGMLLTARDIILRLPGADDDTIRLELAGNLCRCTGYNGIVKAIRRVMDNHTGAPPAVIIPPRFTFPAGIVQSAAAKPAQDSQMIHLALPLATAWEAVQDPALIASCVPGITLTSADAGNLAGHMLVAFGPIQARFSGTAAITYGAHSGTITGQGHDPLSQTRLSATAEFTLSETETGTDITLAITYRLAGPLAQLARPAITALFVTEIVAQTAGALQARLSGAATSAATRLNGFGLAVRVVRTWLRSFVRRSKKTSTSFCE